MLLQRKPTNLFVKDVITASHRMLFLKFSVLCSYIKAFFPNNGSFMTRHVCVMHENDQYIN